MFQKFLLFFSAILFIAGCKSRPASVPPATTPPPQGKSASAPVEVIPPSADELTLVEASNNFAFDMYHALVNAGSPDSNVVFSPFSNFVALAMVGEGARGETAYEIRKALHLSEQPNLVHTALPNMLARFEKKQQLDTSSTLIVGDGLFSDNICPVRKDYQDWFTRLCQGEFQSVNFHDIAELKKTLDLINAWVNEKTREKITNLLAPDDLHPNIVAVLVNTLYFAGKWTHPFDKKDTHEMPFYKTAKDTVHVMMMKRDMRQNVLRMLKMPTFQFLELPYSGGRFSMLIILPNESDGLPAFDSTLNWPTWRDWTLAMSGFQSMTVRIPRLKLSSSKYLIPILETMGVQHLFDPERADLSGMLECMPVWVEKVIHSTYIEVDEAGTVAAAATAYNMALSVPPDFTANRPYLFAIVDNENGALLFMGRIVNPVEK